MDDNVENWCLYVHTFQHPNQWFQSEKGSGKESTYTKKSTHSPRIYDPKQKVQFDQNHCVKCKFKTPYNIQANSIWLFTLEWVKLDVIIVKLIHNRTAMNSKWNVI